MRSDTRVFRNQVTRFLDGIPFENHSIFFFDMSLIGAKLGFNEELVREQKFRHSALFHGEKGDFTQNRLATTSHCQTQDGPKFSAIEDPLFCRSPPKRRSCSPPLALLEC